MSRHNEATYNLPKWLLIQRVLIISTAKNFNVILRILLYNDAYKGSDIYMTYDDKANNQLCVLLPKELTKELRCYSRDYRQSLGSVVASALQLYFNLSGYHCGRYDLQEQADYCKRFDILSAEKKGDIYAPPVAIVKQWTYDALTSGKLADASNNVVDAANTGDAEEVRRLMLKQ